MFRSLPYRLHLSRPCYLYFNRHAVERNIKVMFFIKVLPHRRAETIHEKQYLVTICSSKECVHMLQYIYDRQFNNNYTCTLV